MKDATVPAADPQDLTGDMDDQQELRDLRERERAGSTHLRPFIEGLELVSDQLNPVFQTIDFQALGYQARYRRCALSSMLTGAIAVFLALFQLSQSEEHAILADLEFLFAITSLGIVVWTIFAKTKEKWLLKRLQAERLRLWKFGALIDPAFWDRTYRTDLKTRLQNYVLELPIQTREEIEQWTIHQTVPHEQFAPPSLAPVLADEFRAYYRRKRLGTQLHYLRAKYPAERTRDEWTKPIGQGLFYCSVIAVIAHAVLHHGAVIAKETWLKPMIFLAAGLPAFAAAVRIHRDTREYGRNAVRHRATYNALHELDRRLANETTPAGIFQSIGFCEQVLEADTREWMRLISESEWFG